MHDPETVARARLALGAFDDNVRAAHDMLGAR